MCMLLSCNKLGWRFDLRRWGVFIVTYQSSKELDAEEKMFLDLTLHFRVFLADEWMRQQCQSLEIKVWTKHMKLLWGNWGIPYLNLYSVYVHRHSFPQKWEYDPNYGLVRLRESRLGFGREGHVEITLPLWGSSWCNRLSGALPGVTRPSSTRHSTASTGKCFGKYFVTPASLRSTSPLCRGPATTAAAESSTMGSFQNWLRCSPKNAKYICCRPFSSCWSLIG